MNYSFYGSIQLRRIARTPLIECCELLIAARREFPALTRSITTPGTTYSDIEQFSGEDSGFFRGKDGKGPYRIQRWMVIA